MPIDVALLRGTTADEEGNVTMEREAVTLEALSIAQAAKNSGGVVIVQVERTTTQRIASPREVKIPGVLVDAVVVSTPEEDSTKQFVSYVLDDAQATWDSVFSANGAQYQNARLVLFRDGVQSACGFAQSATGPFYCPGDTQVYIDLGFYDELRQRFGAPGDFAQAYVIAHEVGHHVQLLLGVADKVQALKQQAMQRGDQARANALQVRMELQADCLAGVWASLNDQVKNRLQPGDVESGLNAAAQIGDDTLQKRTQGRVVPEAFTHGSAQQRVRWFRRGLETGKTQSCDTFGVSEL